MTPDRTRRRVPLFLPALEVLDLLVCECTWRNGPARLDSLLEALASRYVLDADRYSRRGRRVRRRLARKLRALVRRGLAAAEIVRTGPYTGQVVWRPTAAGRQHWRENAGAARA